LNAELRWREGGYSGPGVETSGLFISVVGEEEYVRESSVVTEA